MSIKWVKNDDSLIIKAETDSIGINEAREYITDIKNVSERYEVLIFDFSNVTQITPAAMRTLTFAVSMATQINAKVAIVGTPVISQCITQCNLDKVFPFYSSVDLVFETYSPVGLLRNTLAEELDDAIKSTIVMITGCELQPLSFDNNKNYNNNFEIGAIVGISDNSFKGALILGFSTKTYLSLMSKMFGVNYNEISEEISDGPAEVLNMIFGNLKISLNNKGFRVSPAIPTTIMGSNLRIVPSDKNSAPIVLLYQSDFGTFYIELNANYQSQKIAA